MIDLVINIGMLIALLVAFMLLNFFASSESVYCGKCGNENEQEYDYCTDCGSQLEGDSQ